MPLFLPVAAMAACLRRDDAGEKAAKAISGREVEG